MPRIAVVVSEIRDGGVASVARFIVRAIDRSGRYDVSVFSLASASVDECSMLVSRPGTWLSRPIGKQCDGTFGYPYLHVGAFAGELEVARCLPRGVLSRALENCDIVQVVCGSPASAMAVTCTQRPVAVQCATLVAVERARRNVKENGPRVWWRRCMTKLVSRLDDMALRCADAIQVENRWMYEYARSLNSGRKGIVLYSPPGVDTKRFHPATQRRFDGPRYVLCVGRLNDSRKNVGLLLEAFGNIDPQVRSTTRLVLAGTSAPGEEFWRQTRARGLTSSVDYVAAPSEEDLVGLYQNAAAFALASNEEGLGIVLLEAMACGIPAISTRSGGPEEIIRDGVDGFLVDVNDANAMTGRLQRLLTDRSLNRVLGDAARFRVVAEYDECRRGAAFLEVYDELVRRPPDGRCRRTAGIVRGRSAGVLRTC